MVSLKTPQCKFASGIRNLYEGRGTAINRIFMGRIQFPATKSHPQHFGVIIPVCFAGDQKNI